MVGIALAALRSGFVFLGKVITKDQVVDAAANLLAKLINKAADMVHGSGITQQTFDQNIADHELKIALDHMNNFKFSSDPKKVVQEAAERYQAARKVFLLQASSQKGEAGIAFWQYTSELTLLLGLMNLYINDFGLAKMYGMELQQNFLPQLENAIRSARGRAGEQDIQAVKDTWLPLIQQLLAYVEQQENAVRTCEIVYQVSGFWQTANYFWAKASDGEREIQIARSDITFWQYPDKSNPQDQNAFQNLVKKLEADGWVDTGQLAKDEEGKDKDWYSHVFEKKVHAQDIPSPQMLDDFSFSVPEGVAANVAGDPLPTPAISPPIGDTRPPSDAPSAPWQTTAPQPVIAGLFNNTPPNAGDQSSLWPSPSPQRSPRGLYIIIGSLVAVAVLAVSSAAFAFTRLNHQNTVLVTTSTGTRIVTSSTVTPIATHTPISRKTPDITATQPVIGGPPTTPPQPTTPVQPTTPSQPTNTPQPQYPNVQRLWTGAVLNTSGNVSANIQIQFVQNGGNLSGAVRIYPPLSGSGPITGGSITTGGYMAFRDISNDGSGAIIDFYGQLNSNDTISGTFYVRNNNQQGIWNVS